MNSYTRGILISLHPANDEKFIGTTEVLDGPLKGRMIPLLSVADGPAPIPGIEVEFLVVNMRSGGESKRAAIDLRVARLDLEREGMAQDKAIQDTFELAKIQKQEEKQRLSLLWDVLQKIEDEHRKGGVGRGGPKHRYLQQFVKTVAEGCGWSVTVEQQIDGGHKATDAVLEKCGYKIAVEIAVSTVYTEYQNLQKNIEAGYDCVLSISTDSKALTTVRRLSNQRLGEKARKIDYLLPEDLTDFLNKKSEAIGPFGTERRCKIIRGYKVKVTYPDLSPEESKTRTDNALDLIAKAIIATDAHKLK